MDVTSITIVEVDASADDGRLEQWVDVGTQAVRAEFGDRHSHMSVEEVRAAHQTARSVRTERFLAQVDGQVVGEGSVRFTMADNQHLAAGFLNVLPGRRREGVGTALLRAIEQRAQDNDRTVLCLESEVALGNTDGAAAFAARFGYEAALESLRSDLDLPAGSIDGLLEHVEAEAAGHADGYDVLTWWDDVPPEWLDARARLQERMSTDAPMGAVDAEEEVWDAERVRELFQVARNQGRRVVESVVRHGASGELVAYTTLAVPAHQRMGFQWDTLVVTGHRGHRLGQLMKAANLRALHAELPHVGYLVTWNATSNEPMLRVNRALGFRPVGVNTEWQKHLS